MGAVVLNARLAFVLIVVLAGCSRTNLDSKLGVTPFAGAGSADAPGLASGFTGQSGAGGASSRSRDCVFHGVTHAHGSRFEHDCDDCFCGDGRVACFLVPCPDASAMAPVPRAGASAAASCEERSAALGLTYAPSAISSRARSGDDLIAQTFTPSAPSSIREIVLPVYTCKQNFFADAQVEIWATHADGQPDPTRVLARSDVVANDALPIGCVIDLDELVPIRFRFAEPVALDADTLLAVSLVGAGSEAPGELFWGKSDPVRDAPYDAGRAWWFGAHTGGWRARDFDFAFTCVLDECSDR